jgi:hypothetical protein
LNSSNGRRKIICGTVDSLAFRDDKYPKEVRRELSDQQQRATVSFKELVVSSMLTLNALVELLDERGILAKLDV